ncbi:MAG: ABC transporter permease [Anaerolineales bacterium]|nr:ABC transporter permease [Anaerolineales bacterium]
MLKEKIADTRQRSIFDRLGELRIFLWLIVIALIFSFLSPNFLNPGNLLNIAKQSSIVAIVAIGMTFVIITGGIDLSVGSLISFVGAVTGWVWLTTNNIFLAILAGLLTGVVAGLISGLLVGYAKLPPFIATFGMMGAGLGLAFVLTPTSVGDFPKAFEFFGNGKIAGIPTPIILTVLLAIIAQYFLKRTRYGLRLLAIGGSEQSARLAGIDVARYTTSVYVLSGLVSAVGGLVLVARLRSAYPGAGQGYELLVIAATVIGGVDLMGGSGSVISSIAGALLIGMIQNGLNLFGVEPFMQQIVTGCLIVIAVLANQTRGGSLWQRAWLRRATSPQS